MRGPKIPEVPYEKSGLPANTCLSLLWSHSKGGSAKALSLNSNKMKTKNYWRSFATRWLCGLGKGSSPAVIKDVLSCKVDIITSLEDCCEHWIHAGVKRTYKSACHVVRARSVLINHKITFIITLGKSTAMGIKVSAKKIPLQSPCSWLGQGHFDPLGQRLNYVGPWRKTQRAMPL